MRDPRLGFDDQRMLREDRAADPRLLREDPRMARDDPCLRGDDPRMQHEHHGGPQRHPQHQQQPPMHLQFNQPQHHQAHHQSGRSQPSYKLPWEDSLPDSGPSPPPPPHPPDYAAVPCGDTDKMLDGRRRPLRKQSGDVFGGGGDGDRMPGERGTPNHAERGPGTFGFRSSAGSGSATKSGGSRVSESIAASGTAIGFSGSMNGAAMAMRHGASAGTGGSEEWPSNQARAPPHALLREPEYESEKASASQGGHSRRKPGRQSGNLGGVPETPTRRTPEVPDPRPAAEAWRGEAAGVELHGGGLPSIHGGFLGGAGGPGGPQGSGLVSEGGGSRAPSRITASTPTPRDEDSLDMAARQMHGHAFSGGGRWGASAASNEWPGLGGPVVGTGSVAGLAPSELGPVRDTRGPADGRGGMASLGRRADFGSVYQAY